MNAVRLPALVVVAALVVGAFVFKTQEKEESLQVADPISYSELSFGSSVEEVSGDVWFCVGPTNKLGGIDEQVITITNLRPEITEGLKLSVSNSDGSLTERSIQIEAQGVLEILTSQERDTASYVGVTIEAPQGGVLVEQQLQATDFSGVDQRPCVTTASSSWIVPWGTTERPGTQQTLLLYNPFQATAVADLLFVGNQGLRETLDSQGVVIPGRSIVTYDLAERIPDTALLSSYIEVRSGQLIVSGITIADGTAPSGIKGLNASYGSPEIGGDLFLPGSDGETFTGSVVIVNPSESAVEGELVVRPTNPDVFVEPVGFVLRAGQREEIRLSDYTRFEGIGPYSLYVRSLDNPSLSASYIRQFSDQEVSIESTDSSISSTTGLHVLPAIGYGSTHWFLNVSGSSGNPAVVTLFNPSLKSISSVTLSTEQDMNLPDPFELDPGDRATLQIDTTALIEVGSSSPVIVVREWLGPEGWVNAYGVSVEDSVVAIER
ncbi:MAG: hypothetical protein CL420_00480 [Acidimicrobiaceae bacterium]|nr:hypothetical protein [Acidimicrobiaceae bacterium]|tara:strand:+ start:6953 stop:8428 length:1476 start_codon:yes stop_codon:yes gene_type:complete